MNKYGHFSEKGDEFIVTRYDTPLPWTNYLSNGDYCAIVSSTGVEYIIVDGERVEGNFVKSFDDGEHMVEVYM